jgi:hypothetical protein
VQDMPASDGGTDFRYTVATGAFQRQDLRNF